MNSFVYWLGLWAILVVGGSLLWPRPKFRQRMVQSSLIVALVGSLVSLQIIATQGHSQLDIWSKLMLAIMLAMVVQVALASHVVARMDNDYIISDYLDRLQGLVVFAALVQATWSFFEKYWANLCYVGLLLGLVFLHQRYVGRKSSRLLHLANFALLVMVGMMLGELA